MTLLFGVSVTNYSFFESQPNGTSHDNELEYSVSVAVSNIFVLIISSILILLSGDIESNPGPLDSRKLFILIIIYVFIKLHLYLSFSTLDFSLLIFTPNLNELNKLYSTAGNCDLYMLCFS